MTTTLLSRALARSLQRPKHRGVRLIFPAVATVLALASAGRPAQAQLGRITDRIKEKVQEKSDDMTDSLTDLGFDKATGAVKCVATNTACINKAFKSGKHVKVVDAKGKAVSPADSAKAVTSAGGVPASLATANAAAGNAPAADAAATSSAEADATPFINYDFVPGDKVLFADDFSTDKVGDLPGRLKVLSGNFEIADFKGQRFLRTTSGGNVMIPLSAALPQKFTLEFDAVHTWGWTTYVHFTDPDHRDAFNSADFGSTAGIGDFTSAPAVDKSDQVYHARIMADGEHVKVYVDGKRVANVPEGKLGRANGIWIELPGADDSPGYISNIRVAESETSLFDALNASGRVSTHGILFNTNSDVIQPESEPTLQEIGDMLKQHADLKLTIEGHTDNVGSAAANQTLSEKRAAAVRQYLMAKYQIDGSRLASKGFGAGKPAASNDTPEGRQQNRRVELVKM